MDDSAMTRVFGKQAAGIKRMLKTSPGKDPDKLSLEELKNLFDETTAKMVYEMLNGASSPRT